MQKKLRGATKGYANATPWAPRVPLTNTSEQVFRETASRSDCRGGPQGTAVPTLGFGGGACEACGETLVGPLSPVGVY